MKQLILVSALALAGFAGSSFAQNMPAGSTGQCKDGSYTSAASKSGACRGHQGVQSWFATAVPTAATTPAAAPRAARAAAPKAAAPAPAAASAPQPANATGQCKDGSYTAAASKSGACRGHQGVQSWFGGATAPAAAAAPAARPAPAPRPVIAAPPAPAPVAAPMPAPAPRPMSAPVAARPAPAAAPVAGGGNGQVWVNSETKVYHCQGDRWYGATKKGQYMSESAAMAAGMHAERGKSCSAH